MLPSRSDPLAHRARTRAEEPFLFFRTPNGQVDWWSWKRVSLAATGPERLPVEVPDTVREAVAVLCAAGDEEWSAAERRSAAIPPGTAPRPIWLSTRPLTVDAPWLRASVAGGWAVFRDPIEGPAAETFLWARPTLAIGLASELAELLEAVATHAPARRAKRWLGRRLARLEALVVEPEREAPGIEPLLERLGLAPRVVRLPAAEW